MILLVLSSLLIGVFAQNKDVFMLPPSELPKVLEASLSCISETGADADSLHQILVWKVKETPVIKNFLYCLMYKEHFVDENGHIMKSTTMNLIKDYDKKQEVELVLDQCNSLQGKDNKDTLFKSVTCFHSKSPIIFGIST